MITKITSNIWSRVVTWGNFSEASERWYLFVENVTGFLKLKVNGGSITGSTPVNDGLWHHIAYTFENDGSPDVSDVKLYVDGQLDTPSVIKSSPINTGNGSEVTISHEDNSFNGQMDEVRIWNVARTQAQIQANMYHYLSGNEAELQVYYTFDEGTGNTVTDQTPNHRNGTLINMVNGDWIKRPVSFDTTLNMPISDILVGTDVDGSKLTYHIVKKPTHGTIEITDPTNGLFTYTPGDWHREVDQFTYKITDAKYESNQETAFVNINPTTYSTGAYQNGQKEVVELSIPKAQSLIVSISGETEPNRDWLEILQANGTSFNPPKKFSGLIDENFVITGNDTIQVLFTANNSTTTEGATVTIDTRPRVLSNDKVCDINDSLTFSVTDFADYFIDPIGHGLDTIRIISKPSSGELTLGSAAFATNQVINQSELTQLKYTPAPNYAGLDSFFWEGSNGLTDGQSSNQAQVNLLVQAFVDLNGESMDLATAIQQVNSNNAQDNIITLLQDIQLLESLPVITGTVTFEGGNHSISGNEQHQVFFVDGGNVHFANLTIQDGLAQGGDGGDGANDLNPLSYGQGGGGGGGAGMGGAIFSNTGSQIIVENVTFSNNDASGGNGGDGGGRSDHPDGEPGHAGFKHIDPLAFGSGAGGGGSPTGQGSLNGNGLSLGQGGHGNPIGNANAGKSGDSTQMLGIGGGGGGASSLLYGGAGGDGGFGAGSGGSGSHGTDANTVTQVGAKGEFGGQGSHGNFQHAGGGGGGAGLGGAIFVRTGSTVTLMNSTFTNNTATGGNAGNGTEATYNGKPGQGQGGAIFVQTGATVITEGELTLTNNTASTDHPDINGLLSPTIMVVAGPTPAKETDTLAGTFIISSAAHPEENTINFSLDGTATLGTDYTITGATINGTNGTVLMPAMPNNSVTLTITPIDDSDADPDETIQLIINQGLTYQPDSLANSAILTIQDNDSLGFTGLYLETSAPTILNNDELDVVGKLNLFPETGANLAGLPIVLTITAPDGITQETLTENTITDTGQFRFDNLKLPEIFPTSMQEGAFGFQVSFAGTDEIAASTSSAETVLVGASAGYAILVQGKVENEEGLAAHNKTIHRIYKKLRERDFEEANIQYFNYNTTQPGVDAMPSKAAIANAFTDLQTRMNSNPAPFYIIMVDHGSIDGSFHIYNGHNDANDVITPTDLAGWLDNFEAGLNNNALSKARLVMLGACYSGSFIPELSKTGRIIITSATASEESFKGPNEPDGIRSGEFFMEEFFARLGKNDNIKAAFEFATERTEYFTRKGGISANTANRFYDEAVQHPLLDDNGDGQGSNTLSADGDGNRAQTILLGAGLNYDTNALDSPAEILEVGNTVYLNPNESSTTLTAKVNNANRVNAAPVDIRQPSVVLDSNGTENSEQLEIRNLPRVYMNCSHATHSCTTYFDQFNEPGMYEAFYFVRDNSTLDISPVKRSVIYKNYANNPAPSAFDLVKPLDGSEHKTTLIFEWDSTTDADGPVTYNFIIAKDASFSEVVYQQEELETAMTYIDELVGLEDQTTYYWKVEAVDPFGERTTNSSVFSFTTNNTNAPPSIGSLHVSSAVNFISLDNAIIDFWQLDEFGVPILDESGNPMLLVQPPVVHQARGFYNMLLPPGRRRLRVKVAGYEAREVDLETMNGTTKLNVEMIPNGGLPIQPGQLQFAATIAKVNETESTITILVERVDGMDGAISVDYATNCPLLNLPPAGEGTCGSDYSDTKGTLNWSDKDERVKAIYLPIIDDQDYEGDETLTITLSNPSGDATLGTPQQIIVTIVDDEATPAPVPGVLQFSANTYSAEEGDTTLNITVSRTDGSDGQVSVQYLVNGTALLGQDYIGGSGTLTWAEGDNTTKLLNLKILDDDEVEETETLQLTLFSPTGDALLGNQNTATFSITDNDVATTAGLLQFKTATQTVKEGEDITLIVTRTDGNSGEVSVQYQITEESTATSSDYTGGSGTLTWIDGDDSDKSLTIQVIEDDEVEETESIQLTLFNPTGEAMLGSPAQAMVKISDNDESKAEASKAEALDSEKTEESKASALDTEALDAENTKASALDIEAPKADALGSSTNAKAEALDSETQDVLDSAKANATAKNASTTSIVQFATTLYTASEGEKATLTVERTGLNQGEISVQTIVTGASTAMFGDDYTGGNGKLTWTKGDMQPKTFTVTLVEDEEVESSETVGLMLVNTAGPATLGPLSQATVIIKNKGSNAGALEAETLAGMLEPEEMSGTGTLQFMAPFYTINEGMGLVTTFTVTRTGGSDGEVVVQYKTLDEGGALRDFDYVGGSGQLSWAAGDNTPKSIALMILDDQKVEDVETIPLILFEPSGGAMLGSISRATLVIADNELDPLDSVESKASALEREESKASTLNEESKASALVLPNLGRGTAVATDGTIITAKMWQETANLAFVFRGGASFNRQDYQSSLTLSPELTQMVTIVGEIEIDETHQGQTAEILIVAGLIDELHEVASAFVMLNTQGQIKDWDGNLASLAALSQK